MRLSCLGGLYKATQNYIQEIRSDGTKFIRFTPVSPIETKPCIDAICENYRKYGDGAVRERDESRDEIREARRAAHDGAAIINPLLIIPIFIHDFLCIHPFNDWNGRMSRLLTLLLLYKNGYEVGKYVSIEKHIEKTKDAYYDALEEASIGWHEEKENPIPFIKYMLGVILACYREFEDRVNIVSKDSAYDTVKAAIETTQIGKFTKKDIANICSSISEKSVEAAIKKLSDEGYLKKYGSGRGTFYAQTQ